MGLPGGPGCAKSQHTSGPEVPVSWTAPADFSSAAVAPMPDPRCWVTAQDRPYAATALQAQAVQSAEDAARLEYGSTREVLARAAAGQRELAGKVQRI